jgi:hypothetical protein
MITLQPVSSIRLCRLIVPPSRPTKACLRALVSTSLTTRPAGIATLIDTGQVSTCRFRWMPSTAWACITAEAIWLR